MPRNKKNKFCLVSKKGNLFIVTDIFVTLTHGSKNKTIEVYLIAIGK